MRLFPNSFCCPDVCHQALAIQIKTSFVIVNGAQEMGSTPCPGTIQDLTFNLFSILADQCLSANALFWITVWITALGRGPGTVSRGYASRLPPRGRRTGVTGADCEIWIDLGQGVGRKFGGCLRLRPWRVMERWKQWEMIFVRVWPILQTLREKPEISITIKIPRPIRAHRCILIFLKYCRQ